MPPSFLRPLFCSLAAAALIATARAEAEPIKIGEYASLTGKEASLGQSSHQGTVLAVETINAAGGVLGRPLQLITEDTQSKAGESGTAVRKLISRDKVVAILGEVASSRSLEGAPICQRLKVPMVTPASTNPKVTETGDYIFRVCFIDPFQGPVMAKFALETLKAKRLGLMVSASSAYSVGLAKYFKEAIVAGGGTIVAEQRYQEGDKDFKAQLTAIRAAGVDAIFNPGYYNEGALMVKQARDLGITVPMFGADSWEAEALIELGGKAVEGVFLCSHYTPTDPAPRVQDFVRAYRQRWGAGYAPDSNASLGYDSVLVLADAIRRAGSAEPKAIRDALAQTRNFEAVTGTITIDKNRDASKSAVVITVKHGQFQYVQTMERAPLAP
ncbi:ABC transporter substrate-binding protein [Opitutus terrae]|uniref:Extracellular ligand-binding receptor n=1 Tax=Opitutus terrae (strain DSM 11246 / JCM 15787 / PB90-1) TaxID=452637 RepID=B1ZYR7_OPITP|nr:ABC transporter substrate-binding protein [Opitutus terrae]ACB75303.1 Extracellular ligand-binding receptor [Opitutus terrae PB90-1]